jgi:DNA polymerase/3'-5' exonuclease PolX
MTLTSKFVILLSLMMATTVIGFWYAADQEWIHSRWNYDDSEYHYIMQETRRIELEIASYEAQLTDSEEFARKMIDFYRQHRENLQYDKRERERH